ncbi:TRAP transporter small permease [Roseobacter sp. HKCCA0434]|uniref:TRAP transporter small permease n=1 Tax=Roseobacter sp. HKCCA0434 TaxID=3079297 RepID=UPI002905B6E8|nr:TRAP transporter small permease [Roseobacter sp. HKCCA0434]
MRRGLDRLYDLAGAIAALAILAICLLVSAQIVLNILARLGGPGLSYTIPSYAQFAGFMLASASFLALAHTLRRGGHIRVGLLTDRLPLTARWVMEMLALALAAAMTAFATWYTGALVLESLHYGDRSTGMVSIPLWTVQVPVAAGLAILTIAFVHTLIESIMARGPVMIDAGGAE